MTMRKHYSTYWTEAYEDWIGTFHPSTVRFNDALVDPGRPTFQDACQLARLKTGRRGSPWGCVLAVYVQFILGTQANVFVGRTQAGKYYLRLTWNGRRIQRPLTEEESRVALRFDQDYNLPPQVVRVKLNLADGAWRYAPGKPGAHDGGKDRERERTGGTRCVPKNARPSTAHKKAGPSTAKSIRDKMRRRLIKEAAQERQEMELDAMSRTERKFSG